MPAGGRVAFNEVALQEFLTGRDGPVARMLEHQGERVVQEQKRLAPVSPVGESDHPSGQLRSSLGWHLDIDDGDLIAVCGVEDGNPAEKYALDVEFGTRPHEIRSHGDYPLRNRKGQVFGQVVQHPGTEAQPFLRPSIDILRGRLD